ncbi:hypothetical protein AVEN_130314-1 [Araneus ventricosus]|uniref:ATP-dependent DNA helicase n=1 Tax=Araneus ventricosus TaxID=182803 RepID=A0A4Y2BDB3_ARAVE|nr:hypothetical protein AVEN_130314-1 [Araneus ventricosus]
MQEINYDTELLQQRLSELVPRLNPEQKPIFHNVLKQVQSGESGLYFLNAPGGTVKTFLLKLLFAQIRKDKKVAIAVASLGIAATLLDAGERHTRYLSYH